MCFNNFDDEYSFIYYRMMLGRYTAWPQVQNLNHLFAQMNLSDQLIESFESGHPNLNYFTDFMGKTPLMWASELQNEAAVTAIITSFENSEDLFLNKDDFVLLLDEASADCNLAFDTIFRNSEFFDIPDARGQRGFLIKQFYDKFNGDLDNKMIFFTSNCKYLQF